MAARRAADLGVRARALGASVRGNQRWLGKAALATRRTVFASTLSLFVPRLLAMGRECLAISLKQPWATLVVHGVKSVEIRRWSTALRGRVLIHAAKVSDPRPEAWAHVPVSLLNAAKVVGGVVGGVVVTGCISYPTADVFAADRLLHLNDPAWFRPPIMYGFVLTRPSVMKFRPLPGFIKFFPVPRIRT